MLKRAANVDLIHVPYKGSAAAVADVVSGQVSMMFINVPSAISLVRAGKLRALAVTTAMRLEALPGIPTVSEFVPGFEGSGWQGVCAPANTPAEVIAKLNQEINAGLNEPRIKQRIADWACLPLALSPSGFGRYFAGEIEKWTKVIRGANIRVE